MKNSRTGSNWDRLQASAAGEVKTVLQSLPEDIRSKAQLLPITFEPCPNPALIADGIEPDTLGLFVGPDYGQGIDSSPMPPQIILFLENIWDQAEADENEFRAEIRTTLLHELGHYLGWDEDDLTERGLD